MEWFKLSAAQGEPFGKANLGLCYTIGAGGLEIDHDIALKLYRDIDSRDIERYGTVALGETPLWRSNMMKWFAVAAEANEALASLVLLIHNKTDISGETFSESHQSI